MAAQERREAVRRGAAEGSREAPGKGRAPADLGAPDPEGDRGGGDQGPGGGCDPDRPYEGAGLAPGRPDAPRSRHSEVLAVSRDGRWRRGVNGEGPTIAIPHLSMV